MLVMKFPPWLAVGQMQSYRGGEWKALFTMRFRPLEEMACVSAPSVSGEAETVCGWSPCGHITSALGTPCVGSCS